jgi:hypothetical protein
VGFHRAVADAELHGDLAIGVSRRYPDQHLPLPGAELPQCARRRLRRVTANHGAQASRDRRAEERLAPAHRTDRVAKLGRRGVLEQVAVRARPQALEHVFGVVVHAQDEHVGIRRTPPQLGRDPEAGVARHGNVEHRHVRAETRRQLQRLGAGGGLGDDGEPGPALQHVSDPAPHDRVIVRDQHADRLVGHG